MILKILELKGADEVLVRKLHTNSGSNNYNSNSPKNKNYDSVEKRRACLYPWKG